MNARAAGKVTILAAAATLALGAGMPVTHSAAPRWRLVKTFGPCVSQLNAIAAPGPGAAWATGFRDCPGTQLLIARWDGRSWQDLRPPRPYAASEGLAVAGLSRSYAWTFPGFKPGQSKSVALQWHSGRWRAFALPGLAELEWAVAFSRSDAWTFGIGTQGTHGPRSFAARWNGQAWLKAAVPVLPLALSAASPRDVWVVGATPGSPASQVEEPNALARSTGTWHTVPFPDLHLSSSQWFIPFGSTSVVPDHAAGAWVLVTFAPFSGPGRFSLLLHWTGTRWTHVKVPYTTNAVGPVARDGRGGLWLAAKPFCTCFRPGLEMIHYSAAGTWTKVFVPVPNELVDITSMRLISGTHSLWAAGQLGPPEALGAIFKYGQ